MHRGARAGSPLGAVETPPCRGRHHNAGPHQSARARARARAGQKLFAPHQSSRSGILSQGAAAGARAAHKRHASSIATIAPQYRHPGLPHPLGVADRCRAAPGDIDGGANAELAMPPAVLRLRRNGEHEASCVNVYRPAAIDPEETQRARRDGR